MARPTLFAHPKFAKLAARLKSRALAVGSLELIWDAAYASGDPVIGDAEAVEEKADWKGPRGQLAAALREAGFLDLMQVSANGGHVHVVHDLEDHAPDYVLKRWQREAERRQQGKTLRQVRQEAARARWAAKGGDGAVHDANVRPPAPAPAPIRDRSLSDANVEQVHPQPDPRLWTAGTWRSKFGIPWCERKGRIAYGMASDGVACGKLGDLLDQLDPTERLQAQENASAMFAAFLDDTYPPLVKAQHPFAWFVQRFGALMLDVANPPPPPEETGPPKLRPIREDVLAPIGGASAARARASALRTQPHAASGTGPGRTDTASPPLRSSGVS